MPHIKKLVLNGFKSFPRETEIPLDRSMNCIVGPNGAGKSCSYDTLVTLSNGKEIEIGKLVEEHIKKSGQLKKLDDGIYVDCDGSIEVISLNKNSMKAEKKKVSKLIKRDGELIYKIETRTGKQIKATGCHPVMISKDGEIKSVLIRDLEEGSLIATPRIIRIVEDEKCNPDLARLIGYLIGDGYIAKDRIEFLNQDKEVIEDYKNLIKKYFEVNLKIRIERNATRIYIRNKNTVEKIRNLFYKNYKKSITSDIKKIPSFLLTSDKESTTNLLAGLYDTDGNVRKDREIIEFCTKNKGLANQIQGLLLRFGIISKIKKRVCSASNTKNKIKRNYYYIYIYGIENLKRFDFNIPLKIKYKKDNIRFHLEKNTIPNPNTDLLPREINKYVKEIVQLLGIKAKPLKNQYPSLLAYIENRCLPTRQGILRVLPILREKLSVLELSFSNIEMNQSSLVSCMDQLSISGQQASKQIGLHRQVIRRDWATNKFNAKPKNLEKFYNLIKNNFAIRIFRAKKLLKLLYNLANSDIFWDEIISIEKLKKEPFVYDLTIDENHNFIANNIFVHNSNLADALCFVLGRLSIKSMRAAKAANLIFAGTKMHKPASEASVSMIFDNSDKIFSLPEKEIILKRIVRRNGQSIYKINNSVKTRQEILELLAQAGIDPYGFNIILQGEIDSFVKMHPEERRKIIEEVAGISVYEIRKQKSLRELEKTENKLKEVSAILRERTAYLKNLEDERRQALRFKKLEEAIKRDKASLLTRQIKDKQRGIYKIRIELNKKDKNKTVIKIKIEDIGKQIEKLSSEIENINKNIESATGIEQEKLHAQVTEAKSELAGLSVRIENYKSQLESMDERNTQLKNNIIKLEEEIRELEKEKGKKKEAKLNIEELKSQLLEAAKIIYNSNREIFSLNKELAEKINESKNLILSYTKKYELKKATKEIEFILNLFEQSNEKTDKLFFKLERANKKINSLLKAEVSEEARNIGLEIDIRKREINSINLIIKRSLREKEGLEQEIEELISELEDKQQEAENKEKQEQHLRSRFKKLFEKRANLHNLLRAKESAVMKHQSEVAMLEQDINNIKIDKAKIDAAVSALKEEMKEFSGIKIISASQQELEKRITRNQEILTRIGTVNLRALEVYDNIKKEYDAIADKVEHLNKEKEEILKIIEEIDNKKKKTFNKTLEEVNSLFSRNFSQLSTKGYAFLKPENREDVFTGGLDIIIKVGKGKYFDVTSLSGGEQTLIALALIFAIQEYRPYCFYIFDEIDAALDKRNSERLAVLLKKHMKSGQYLMITHNDALISEATTLYGVSMQDGVSKVLSLEV